MILIKNGLVIDPGCNIEAEMDVLIDGAVIRDVGTPGSFASATVQLTIDARGKWVVPGLIDLHVHLREPGFEWKETIETGSQAALLGGFTTVCCMPNTSPQIHNAEIVRFILETAAGAGGARVLPIGAVSMALEGRQMAPLSELREAGCVAFSDDGEPVWDPALMRRALEWCLMLGTRISCHEEDKALSAGGCMNESALSYRLGLSGMAKAAEEVMIARDIELARVTGGKVHICHISTARGVELVRRAKNDGIDVSAEVTPHHLTLTEEAVAKYDTYAKMSPPLRESADLEALQRGLSDGTIDAVASDHAPHEDDSKQVEFGRAAFGIIGLQTNLAVMLSLIQKGTLSRRRAIEALTAGPARVFGLESGSLKNGSRADITVIAPDLRWTFEREIVRSKSKNSPYLGAEFRGAAETVVLDGKICVEDRKLRAEK